MAKKKRAWVVWNGRVLGVFDTWPAAEASVLGYPGARHLSFKSPSLARTFWREIEKDFSRSLSRTPASIAQRLIREAAGGASEADTSDASRPTSPQRRKRHRDDSEERDGKDAEKAAKTNSQL